MGGTGSCNFLADTTITLQISNNVLRISILPQKILKWEVYSPKFSIFGQRFSDEKNIFRQFSDSPTIIRKEVLAHPLPFCHDASASMPTRVERWPS